MHLNFVRCPPGDRDFVADANRDPAYRGHLAGGSTVAELRAGTAAIAAHATIRKPHPAVSVTAGRLGGVPCETLVGPDADEGRTLLYLHGGAFTRGSLEIGRGNASLLAAASAVRVIAVAYRQAPEHRYPAAPHDVLNAYQALRAAGTSAKRIAVVGESSGGCLALGLAVMLADQPSELPAGIAAISPMTDLELRGASWLFNGDKDLADLETGRRLSGLYIDDSQRSDPMASPARHHFRACCPIFIGVGSHETMLSDAERTAFRADETGVDVELTIYEGMPHGFTRFDVGIGTQAIVDAAQWCVARMERPGPGHGQPSTITSAWGRPNT
jgi:epsilon-lactone hydrolase